MIVEIKDKCPTQFAMGFLWEPTEINVTLKSNRREACKLFTENMMPAGQTTHVNGMIDDLYFEDLLKVIVK